MTLPHVDYDLDRPRSTLDTYLAVVEGAELIVAWSWEDCDDTTVLRDIPSLARLASIPSLTVIRAVAGDVIFMPRNTVHMVVTEKRNAAAAAQCALRCTLAVTRRRRLT